MPVIRFRFPADDDPWTVLGEIRAAADQYGCTVPVVVTGGEEWRVIVHHPTRMPDRIQLDFVIWRHFTGLSYPDADGF